MIRPVLSFFLLGFLLSAPVSANAAPRPERVPVADRELVAIVNLSILKNGAWHYRYEENRAVKKILRDLGRSYGKIVLITGAGATHDSFLSAIDEAERDPTVKAVDSIVYLHGHPGEIGFVDTGFYPVDLLRDEILALPDSAVGGRKLRALYSDACYGETHLSDWLRAGFRVAAGSVGTDSNWSLDLGKFMRAWRKGKSFGSAIDRANSVWATGIMDWFEKGDSFKRTGGDVDFTMDRPTEAEVGAEIEVGRP